VWNLAALLPLNVVALRLGWWRFGTDVAVVAGVPADLWVGWAVLWGAVPVLATTRRLPVTVVALVAVDFVVMPQGEPALTLGGAWLVGETVAVAVALVPGLLLGRWTVERRLLAGRATLQAIGFGALAFYVVPSLAFTVTGAAGWGPLLARPRWQFVVAALALAPPAAMAFHAVREFVAHGGTPVPFDPPTRLVTTGPYAYVANPMQVSMTLLLVGWGALLWSPGVIAAAAMVVVFSAGVARRYEDDELDARFGEAWRAYRREVPNWRPRWRPYVAAPATIYAATTCGPCREVGRFLTQRAPVGLAVTPAESCPTALRRITYVAGVAGVAETGGGAPTRATGIAALAHGLEHVNLAWAAASWVVRLPGLVQALQLITDAVGGGPREVGPRPADEGWAPASALADREGGAG
jgi:protein-S-isoprenylcysteine O-methyltransferase Ste14